ncbi:MAG: hypothetical protein JXQ73_22170 [Phycisphaerae bacterium]|nr:hypothetical protein [Phycisphaerae bacterium]
MTTARAHVDTLSEGEGPKLRLSSGAADETSLAEIKNVEAYRDEWQQLIDTKLVEWGRNPRQLEEDDLVAPSVDSVEVACQVAMYFRDDGAPSPDWVVPNGDGGIVFERSLGTLTKTLEVLQDGSIESIDYRDSKIIRRERIL